MSFDLMAFDLSGAPRSQGTFDEWVARQTQWSESHSYDDPSVSSEALQNWFSEMKKTYPPMNGPLALSDEEFDKLGGDEVRVTDYSIGREVIYCAFAWSVADEAHEHARKLAAEQCVGFYCPESGEVFFPDTAGREPLELRTNWAETLLPTWRDVEQAIGDLTEEPVNFIFLGPKTTESDIQFIQAIIEWVSEKKSLFRKAVKTPGPYCVEAQIKQANGALIHHCLKTSDIAEVKQIFMAYFNWRTAPDVSGWEQFLFWEP
ncbi:hypothetical protein FACS1894187_01010 [Synergistales bacterium]|nr:hypothetical protein FACS1894187_01010 [Synergistales bacterium]